MSNNVLFLCIIINNNKNRHLIKQRKNREMKKKILQFSEFSEIRTTSPPTSITCVQNLSTKTAVQFSIRFIEDLTGSVGHSGENNQEQNSQSKT